MGVIQLNGPIPIVYRIAFDALLCFPHDDLAKQRQCHWWYLSLFKSGIHLRRIKVFKYYQELENVLSMFGGTRSPPTYYLK